MVERLRTLLDRPLHPSASRAILVLASAVSVGFASLAVVGGLGDRPGGEAPAAGRDRPASTTVVGRASASSPPTPGQIAGQDGQDRAGTAAHRRVAREVASHRALQHVPYRTGAVSIGLVGVERGKAVLRVKAPTIVAARGAWRDFLQRYDDDGRAYLPRFEATGGGHV
ncbi:MAG: hypothetical protein JSU06_00525 [Actinobacteria bacterium]|nr:hypothetical protein [Actinomycetota bacterium]